MADARIFADLKADHDRHREMLAKLAGTSGDSAERRALFEAFRIEVSAHAAAEEESLYAAMLARPELRDEARHSVAEHKEIDDFLAALVETDMSSPGWLARFREMRHRYEHHIDEEEKDMFPAAAKDLPKSEQDRIAKVFEARKPREVALAAEAEPGDERE
jgi:hypothetical protein